MGVYKINNLTFKKKITKMRYNVSDLIKPLMLIKHSTKKNVRVENDIIYFLHLGGNVMTCPTVPQSQEDVLKYKTQ